MARAAYKVLAGLALLAGFATPDILATRQQSPVEVHLIWSTDCPVAQRWIQRVAVWSQAQDSTRVFLWFPNDELAGASAYVKKFGLKGVLKPGEGAALAYRYGVDRLPSTIVMRPGSEPVFVGALGDSRDAVEAKRFYVADALSAARRNQPMTPKSATPQGCTIPDPLVEKPGSPVTFTQHIRPFLDRKCVSCHSPGGSAPFRLDSYSHARRWSHMMVDVLERKMMPPVQLFDRTVSGDVSHLPSEKDLEMVRTWREFGAPLGEDSGAPSDETGSFHRLLELPTFPVPSLGTPRLVDLAIPLGGLAGRRVANFGLTGVEQGEVRWAGVFLVPGSLSNSTVTDRGRRWKRTPSDWRLVEAFVPGVSNLVKGAVQVGKDQHLVVRIQAYGTEADGPLDLRLRWREAADSEPTVNVSRLVVPDARYPALDGAVDLFVGATVARGQDVVGMTMIADPAPSELALFSMAQTEGFIRTMPGFLAPTFSFQKPVRWNPGETLNANFRFGGPKMMDEPGLRAVVIGDVWNGANAELWLRTVAK